ncbi:hypothetical protein R1sor_015372 [Riccia sorocarpa]|uniref:Uncharacterized protein n=1 Tax=Riccia sorocarpa TaxID=122646 RepID=A0ABD3HCH5_9MARC
MRMSYEANQGVVGGKQLQIENASRAVNAFDDTRAEWDAEMGQLVHERDQLKDELLKAQAEAELLKKHAEGLKTQFEHERSEWERENRQLVEEIASLQDSHVAIAEREVLVLFKVESVQDLKDQIRQKEEELDRVRTDDATVYKKLVASRKKVNRLNKLLKEMPAWIIVKSCPSTSEVLAKGGSWEIGLYPLVYRAISEYSDGKQKSILVLCTLCIQLTNPGTYGVVPGSWVKEFGLNRQLDAKAIADQINLSEDGSCFASEGLCGDVVQITGDSARFRYFTTTDDGIPIRYLHPPKYRVIGKQFKKWLHVIGATLVADWKLFWDHLRKHFWVWVEPAPSYEVAIHNRALASIKLSMGNVGPAILDNLRLVNIALSIRLRPSHGIALEYFIHALLALPWAFEAFHILWSVGAVTVYTFGHIPLDMLCDPTSYICVPNSTQVKLSSYWAKSKLWSCDHSYSVLSGVDPLLDEDDESCPRKAHEWQNMPLLKAKQSSWLQWKP